MSAFRERRVADLAKVRELAAASRGKLRVVQIDGDPMQKLVIE